jgi:hypothetical protein
MKTLSPGFHQATLESVWPRSGTFGDYWQWNFSVEGYKLRAFTSASLRNEKARGYLGAVLGRIVEPDEELYASDLGGESCTLQVGTIQKDGRTFNTIEDVM